jgi:hypothetical protein
LTHEAPPPRGQQIGDLSISSSTVCARCTSNNPADPFFTAAFRRPCEGSDQDCEDFSLDGTLESEEKCAFRNG